VARMTRIDERLAVLEQKINANQDQIKRIIDRVLNK